MSEVTVTVKFVMLKGHELVTNAEEGDTLLTWSRYSPDECHCRILQRERFRASFMEEERRKYLPFTPGSLLVMSSQGNTLGVR